MSSDNRISIKLRGSVSNYDVETLLLKATRIQYCMAYAASFYRTCVMFSLLKLIQKGRINRPEFAVRRI